VLNTIKRTAALYRTHCHAHCRTLPRTLPHAHSALPPTAALPYTATLPHTHCRIAAHVLQSLHMCTLPIAHCSAVGYSTFYIVILCCNSSDDDTCHIRPHAYLTCYEVTWGYGAVHYREIE
jgi:hypothetical protein